MKTISSIIAVSFLTITSCAAMAQRSTPVTVVNPVSDPVNVQGQISVDSAVQKQFLRCLVKRTAFEVSCINYATGEQVRGSLDGDTSALQSFVPSGSSLVITGHETSVEISKNILEGTGRVRAALRNRSDALSELDDYDIFQGSRAVGEGVEGRVTVSSQYSSTTPIMIVSNPGVLQVSVSTVGLGIVEATVNVFGYIIQTKDIGRSL